MTLRDYRLTIRFVSLGLSVFCQAVAVVDSPCQIVDAALGGVVGGDRGDRHHGIHGRHVDDRTTPLSASLALSHHPSCRDLTALQREKLSVTSPASLHTLASSSECCILDSQLDSFSISYVQVCLNLMNRNESPLFEWEARMLAKQSYCEAFFLRSFFF